MGELIFFAVIILFSILESIARGKKKKAGESVPVPGEWEPEAGEWEAEERASDRLEPYASPMERAGSPAEEGRKAQGSEGMVPEEIWEEIAGLARGRGAGAPTRPVPTRPAPPPRRIEPRRPTAPSTRVAKAARPDHIVHQAHVGYGTDPSERAPSEQDGLGSLAQKLSLDATAVHSVLGGERGPEALRQAMILYEVLGPPTALRRE